MKKLLKDIWYKPWKWKPTLHRLIAADCELHIARQLSRDLESTIRQLIAENQGIRRENEKLKTDLQNVLNTIRVVNNLDRRAPKVLLHR